MEILISESQLKVLITEASDFAADACKTFTDSSSNQFCKSVYDILKSKPRKNNDTEWNNLFRRIQRALNLVAEETEGEYKVIYKNIKNFQEIYTRKVYDLEKLINKVSPSCVTLKERATNSLRDLQSKGKYMLLYKKVTEDGEVLNYSLLNRLNTNISGLSILMTEYAIHYEPTKSPEEIVDLFFRNVLGLDKSVGYLRDVLVKPNHIRKKIVDTIEKIKIVGDKNEEQYLNYLSEKGEKFIPFGDDFGIVDMLGIDVLILRDGQYFPLQVKSSKSGATGSLNIWQYNQGGCKCFVSYKKDGEWYEIDKPMGVSKKVEPEPSIKKSNKKGTFTVNCKTLTPWSPDNINYYKFCNGSSVSAEQIPKSAKYVEIVQGGKVRDLIDVESTIIKTKKNDTKTGRYGDIIYTIFYKIKT
jgi:hypothetical protein